tara:strand:+ start:5345 stop:6727 length:1383 start_codon:yes stop_codon:yes gene_type:complete
MLQKNKNLYFTIEAKTNPITLNWTAKTPLQELRISSSKIITRGTATTISTTTSNAGTVDETSLYSFQCVVPYNKDTTLASFSVSTKNADFRLLKPATLTLRDSTDGLSIYIEQDPVSLSTYYLRCNLSREITLLDNITIDLLIPNMKTTPAKETNIITRVVTGSTYIPVSGIKKNIKIFGAPNTPFELTLLNANNDAITHNANGTSVTPYGVKKSVNGVLDKTGRYSCLQKFPPIVSVRRTKVNGNFSAGATDIIFDNLSGVLVGDQIILTENNGARSYQSEVIKVTAINVSGNANKCTISKEVPLADNTTVSFRRGTSYKLNIETSGRKGDKIISTYPTKTFSQDIGSIITFNATTSDGAIQINGGSGGADHSVSYGYSPLDSTGFVELIYTLTGKTFTQASGKPISSDFVRASGDADIDVKVRSKGAGTSTYLLICRVRINYGKEDTVVNINIDNIVS